MLGTAIVTAGLAALGAVAVQHWGWKRVPSYEAVALAADSPGFLPWAEHDRIVQATGWPQVLRIDGPGDGAAIYFGASHTRNPDDPQIARIISEWAAFQPTVALVEGRMGLYLGPLPAGVRMFGESGAVYALARQDDAPVYSLEPAYEDEVAALLATYTPEQVAAFFTLRVFWSEMAQAPNTDPDARFLHLLHKRTDLDSLRGVIASTTDMDALWQRDFPDQPGWRTPRDDFPPDTWLAQLADADREVRGRHMVATIADLVTKGERVFAVVGGSHVIRQEAMLRAALPQATFVREPQIAK